MTSDTRSGGAIGELSSILWQERTLLEDLLFALETERWVLSTGRSRWLGRAADLVGAAGDRLRDAEVLRAAESDVLAGHLGLAPAPSLVQLAHSAGEPWSTILLDQRAGLIAAAADVTAAAGPSGRSGGGPPVRRSSRVDRPSWSLPTPVVPRG